MPAQTWPLRTFAGSSAMRSRRAAALSGAALAVGIGAISQLFGVASRDGAAAGSHHIARAAGLLPAPRRGFDLVCFMDCLHDLGDPLGALVHAADALKPDGRVMLVEPYAGDAVEENLNPVGRLFYAASAMACTPNSLSQEGGLGLGVHAGDETLRRLAQQAGFSDLRLATRTPVNLVLEARR
jgi:SAM-dependent methyltransferase